MMSRGMMAVGRDGGDGGEPGLERDDWVAVVFLVSDAII